jgi:hypothetical protein
MPTGTTEPTLLDKLRSQRNKLVDDWADFITARETERAKFEERAASDEFKALPAEKRDAERNAFKDAEATFKADSDQRKMAIEEFDARVADQEDIVRRRRDAADAGSASPSLQITNEPRTYRSDNAHELSYWADIALVHGPGITLKHTDRDQAQRRLNRHAEEWDVELPKRYAKRDKLAREAFEQAERDFWASHRTNKRAADQLARETRGGLFDPFERRIEPNSTPGQGGYFIPPEWLVDQFIPGLRAHRVVANLPRLMPMPAGTNSINVPKLNTLTVVGYQQANNGGLPSQDWTDTAVTANVKTVGGYSDIALQLLELSPGNIVDEVVTTDLMAAHDKFLDQQIIAGDGLNANSLNGGHLIGIYNPSGTYTNNGGASGAGWAGTNTVTYTDGSPSGLHLPQGVFGPMWSKIATNRFVAGGDLKFAIHGSRWGWYSTTPDLNGRPIGETLTGGKFNVQIAEELGLPAEGLAGVLTYLSDAPVYIDDNIPVTDTTGGGTNQDIAMGGLWDDSWLFEDALHTDVFREVLSGSNGVRFRIYGYKAFLVRYGQSFAVATGSGFAKPSTGYGDYFR